MLVLALVVAVFAAGAVMAAVPTKTSMHASRAVRVAGPTIILGTKDFTEEFVLGELYKQSLQAKGFTVKYKPNIGATEIIDTALTSGKINMYPEYIGEIVQTVFNQKKLPSTARGWWLL